MGKKAIPFEKRSSKVESIYMQYLEHLSKLIAYLVCVGLLLASILVVINAFQGLLVQDINLAVQDGLFVLILLEMFYVTRSFIRHGSINVAIVINVGVIAAVKEMIFQLNNLTLELAAAFGVIFFTLSLTYFAERVYFKKVVKGGGI